MKEAKYKERGVSRHPRGFLRVSITILTTLLIQIIPKTTQKPICKPDNVDSPINIKFPMSYVPFQIDFSFRVLNRAELIKVSENHLKIMGEFGAIFYQNIEYRIYDLHFKYPSEHRINGMRYALELQISSVSLDGAEFITDVLFERNDYMPIVSLDNYGFNSDFVKGMPTLKKDPKKARFTLHGALTMNDFLKDKKNFYLYEGSNINNDCKTALHLMLADPLWVSGEQLSIFKEKQEPEYRTKRYSNAVIYQNFIKDTFYKLHNVTNTRRSLPNGPVPGPYSHLPFMFQPQEGKPLGFLNKDFIPIWGGIPGGIKIIEPEFPPERVGHVKFVKIGYRPFKMPGLKRPFYLVQYLMVSRHYQMPMRGSPETIPVYMRAKYLTQAKYVPVIKVKMPLLFEGRNSTNDKDKLNKTDPSIACKKWWLHVTLNRNFQHELQYKNISDSIRKLADVRKCADYFLLPNKKKMMKDLSARDFGTNNVTINSTGTGSFGQICKTHLHVMLNRDSDTNLGDYVYHGCYTRKSKGAVLAKKINFGKLTAFGQAGVGSELKGLNEDEQRKVLDQNLFDSLVLRNEMLVEHRNLKHMEGQVVMGAPGG